MKKKMGVAEILAWSMVISALVVAFVPPNWATSFMIFMVVCGMICLAGMFTLGAGEDVAEFVVMFFGLGMFTYAWMLLQVGRIFPIVIHW